MAINNTLFCVFDDNTTTHANSYFKILTNMKFKVYDLNPAVITNEHGRDIGWFFAGGAAEHTSRMKK